MPTTRGFLVRVRCNLFGAKRHYLPADLIKLLGDQEHERLTLGMRCEACGRKDYLSAEYWSPAAQELQGQKIRRLVAIKILRRPVWRDEEA